MALLENLDEFFHIYSDTGRFIPKLFIENEYGCIDSIQKELYINPVFSIYIPTGFFSQ